MQLLRQGVAAQHQATAFQEASRTARREVVQQVMVQGAPWRLRPLRHDAVLALGVRHGGLCAVSPTTCCRRGGGMGKRGMSPWLLTCDVTIGATYPPGQ